MTGIIGDDDLERLINLSRKFDGGENSFKRGWRLCEVLPTSDIRREI